MPQGQVQVEIKNNAVTVKDTAWHDIKRAKSSVRAVLSQRKRPHQWPGCLGSIVRRLVHQFEWKISVQSNVGEGTEVTINFG